MKKAVSPNERLYLACEPLYPPFLIQLKISGSGKIDAAELQVAVEKTANANPGCRLKLEGRKWVDSNRSPRVRKSPLTHELIHTGITDATCEVVIDGSDLLFRAFHGVMDARGLVLWTEDVFRALRNEPVVGALSTMTDREAVLTRKKPREKPKAKFASLARGETSWSFVQLPPEPNLLARVASTLSKLSDAKTKYMIPVDLRPMFPDVRTTGNFSNPIFIEVEPGEKAAQIQAMILRKLANESQFATSASDAFLNYVPLSLQRKAVTAAQRSMDKNNRYLMTAVLSNLGFLPLAKFSTETFRANRIVSLPLDTPFCPLTIIMTEHENGHELAISARSSELVDRLRTELTQEMRGPERAIGKFFDHFKADETCIAVSHGDRTITYGELDRWSSGVAAKLPKVDRIAIQMKHSIELIVAILAVMKSGAAFVPVDPTLPLERIEFITQTAQHTLTTLPPVDDARAEASPGEIAYVIFTSGSTGLPKGVEVSHRSLMNYLEWAKDAYGSNHRSALVTSIGFDLTLTSILLPLISNGEIRIYDNDPFIGLRDLQAENAVTFLKVTPSHLRILHPMPSVKTLVVGGEQLTTASASRWSADVFNEYGPTEATIGCVVHKFDRDRDLAPVVPIGRPIANTKLTITNGELIIEGECVAEGYLGQMRFHKRYRSGDLVEKKGQTLIYLGRADRQMKINGVRIEPAEIEAAIVSHPSVSEAVVGMNSTHHLVAYYKSTEEIDLRAYLDTKLARSVIPAILERKSEFPLSANGKLNFEVSAASIAPAEFSPNEKKVRDLAAQILDCRLDSIPRSERLGLDSLSLVILLDKLEEPALFERAHEFASEPTVEKIAAVLTSLNT